MKKLKNVLQVFKSLSLLIALIFILFSAWLDIEFNLAFKITCSISLFYLICKLIIEEIEDFEDSKYLK